MSNTCKRILKLFALAALLGLALACLLHRHGPEYIEIYPAQEGHSC